MNSSKKIIFIILSILLCAAQVSAQKNIYDLFSKIELFLGKYHFENGFDYFGITNNSHDLDTLMAAVSVIDTTRFDNPDKKKAFWINIYNLIVIDIIVKNYPLNSIVELDGFFTRQKRNIAGENLSLTQIRDNKIFAIDQDPRIDLALIFPAISSPSSGGIVYYPDNISEQLDLNMVQAVNKKFVVAVDSVYHKVHLNKIFLWYEDNFIGKESSIIAYINKYSISRIPLSYIIEYLPFNWRLNIIPDESSTANHQ